MTPCRESPTMRHENNGANDNDQSDEMRTHILVCNICGQPHETHECPFLCEFCYIKDTPKISRARQSLPSNLELIPMADCTMSVVARRDFARGTTFGPFEAKRNWTMNPLTAFPIKIFRNMGTEISYLDYSDEDISNWMCFIPPASNAKEQNLICYQMKDNIYYSAMRTIPSGEQLRVWYAPYYAAKMKMPLFKTGSVNDDEICSSNMIKHETVDAKTNDTDSTVPDHSLKWTEQLAAERLGARNIKENWTCRMCKSEIKTVIAYAKHLMVHYKLILGVFCDICNKKFPTMALLKKHQFVMHPQLKSSDETIFTQPTKDGIQQYTKVISTNIRDAERQTSNVMKVISEKSQEAKMIGSTVRTSDEVNQHLNVSSSDINTLNINDLLLNNGISIENLSAKSILDHQGLNMNLSSMAESFLTENISSVATEKFNVEQLTSLLDISPDTGSIGNNPNNLDCDICGKKFTRLEYVYRHLRKHAGEFICPICLTVYARKENLDAHVCINSKTNVEEFECPHCQKTFTLKKYLKRHMSQHLDLNMCKWCRLAFTSKKELDEHKCQAPYYVCSQCNKRFSHRAHLARHTKLHLGPKPRITKVKKKVSEEKLSICEKCGDVFRSLATLQQHLKSHSEPTYECDICQRRFHRIGVLKEHKQVHQSAQVPCNTCGKKFKSKKALDVHVLLHGNKRIQCDKCGKRFFQRCNYLKHYKQIHSKQPIFKCSVCSAECANESDFTKHMNSHTKLAQYSCTSCTKSFDRESQLKRHMQSSHSNVVYRCPFCEMVAKHRHSMRRHFRKQHAYASAEWDKPGFVDKIMEDAPSTTNKQESALGLSETDVEKSQGIPTPLTNVNNILTIPVQTSFNNERIVLQAPRIDEATSGNNELSFSEVPQLSISESDTQLAASVLNNTYIFDEEGGNIMFYVLDNAPLIF